jgi:sugar phosphate isomerase/epimerase
VRAQEKLGWRLGIEAYTFHKFTFFEAIDKTAQLGLPYIGGLSFQKVSNQIAKNFDPQLSDDELRAIRLKLDAAGLRLLTYYIHDLPKEEDACRRIFDFGRKMGIETFLSEPKPEALDTIERLCDEYGINVGLHNHDAKASPHYWHPEKIAKLCQGRSRRLGACGDVGYWLRSGIDPVEAVRTLKGRLITLQMHDLHALGPEGHDVPWGTGVGQSARLLEELHALGVRPTMIGLEYSYHWFESMPEIARSIEFYYQTAPRLAR